MERKVIKMGDSSLVVSLPKAWVDKAGVVRGGSVDVAELSTGELVIKPKVGVSQRREVEISPDEKSIDHCIIDNYVNGTDVIKISSRDTIDPKIMSTIYNTVPNLSGFEITEARSSKVKIEYLGGVMPFKKLFSRFTLIITNYLKSFEIAFEKDSGADVETIKKMKETDKLYYSLLRNLIMAAESVRIASEMELRSKDSVYYALLIKNIFEMAKKVENIDFFTTEHNQKLASFFNSALSCHRKAMEAWNKKNRELALEGMEEIENTLREVKSLSRNLGGNQGAEPGEGESASRVAKLKGMVVASEKEALSNTLNNLQDILYYIKRNLEIATINSAS
ncbi:MAG: AbrB/MazE/SpoVT family DNA-binding domain-containing protein [Candidatus Hydrothermarchaeaceae archaeon]